MEAILADLVLVVHGAFVLFVVIGGLLALRWPRLVWAHVPAAAWGAYVELAGRICPLTPLENRLRGAATETGFIERTLEPLLYPGWLDRGIQLWLGALVIAGNMIVYTFVYRRARRRWNARTARSRE